LGNSSRNTYSVSGSQVGAARKQRAAEAIIGAVNQTAETFGSLDVLVNNAGTAVPKPFEEGTLAEFDLMIALNVRGMLIATQAALKHIGSGGRIINIGSCVGERMMTPGLVAYSATKGAVKMFTQGLSREVSGIPQPAIGQRLRKLSPRSTTTAPSMRSLHR
jgi:3-oxoacyl-[acyl-carrier protein] reductase